MGVLDKNYEITVDIKSGKVVGDEVIFASGDKNVSNVNIYFTKDNSQVPIDGFDFIAYVQTPDTLTTTCDVTIVDKRIGLCTIDFPNILTTESGVYNVEIRITKDTEISHTERFSYTVRDTLSSNVEV